MYNTTEKKEVSLKGLTPRLEHQDKKTPSLPTPGQHTQTEQENDNNVDGHPDPAAL